MNRKEEGIAQKPLTLVARIVDISHEQGRLVHVALDIFHGVRLDGRHRRRHLGRQRVLFDLLQALLVDREGRLILAGGAGRRGRYVHIGVEFPWRLLLEMLVVELEGLIKVVRELLYLTHGGRWFAARRLVSKGGMSARWILLLCAGWTNRTNRWVGLALHYHNMTVVIIVGRRIDGFWSRSNPRDLQNSDL